MTRVLLVPDLPLERWPAMDRYAHRLHDWLETTDPGFEVRIAASMVDLTRDRGGGGGCAAPRGPQRGRQGRGRLAHPRRRVRGAAAGQHRGAQLPALAHPLEGADARRGGRVSTAGRGTVLERSAAPDRAAAPAGRRAGDPAG